MKPWETPDTNTVGSGKPWETHSLNRQGYAPIPSEGGADERIFDEGSQQVITAPAGTSDFFARVQNDDVFDTPPRDFQNPSSVLEETVAGFEAQGAALALVANHFGLIGDSEAAEFAVGRTAALRSAQQRSPEYVKNFNEEFDSANGIFGQLAAILNNPRAIGRVALTQSANATIPLITSAIGAVTGGFTAGAAGSVIPGAGTAAGIAVGGHLGRSAGGAVGESIIEVGATMDALIQERIGGPVTVEAFREILENDAIKEEITILAQKKGLTTAGVGLLFNLAGGPILRALGPATTKVKKAAVGTAGVALETVGEGAGEAAGQQVAFGEIDTGDVLLESVSGLALSAGTTGLTTSTRTLAEAGNNIRKRVSRTQRQVDAVIAERAARAANAVEADPVGVADGVLRDIDTLENETINAIEQESARAAGAIGEVVAPEPTSAQQTADQNAVTITTDADTNTVDIQRQGESVGNLAFVQESNVVRLTESRVNEAVQRQGIGTEAHRQFIDQQLSQGNVVESQPNPSPAVQRIFAKLEEQGYTVTESQPQRAEGTPTQEQPQIEGSSANTQSEGQTQTATEPDVAPTLTVTAAPAKTSEVANAPTQPATRAPLKDLVDPEFLRNVEQIKINDYGYMGGILLPAVNKFTSSVSEGFARGFVPISTRLRNIAPRLAVRLRKYEFDLKVGVLASNKQVRPFLIKYKTLDSDSRIALDYAMKNSNVNVINAIAQSNDMVQEVQAVRDLLDDIYNRAQDVGIDVRYRSFFFPRRIQDPQGLLEAIHGTDTWAPMREAIERKEKKLERTLTEEERINIVDTLLRGQKAEGVTLAQKGIFKERSIEELPPELAKYYEDSNKSLLTYIAIAEDAIATSKFFGKGIGLDGTTADGESIGTLVTKLADEGDLTSGQARIVKDVLDARFNEGRLGWVGAAFRDLTFLDVLGSPLNAMTQLADLAPTVFNAGIVNTLATIPSAATERTQISLDDLGIDKIAQEFDNDSLTSNFVNKTFTLTGFNKIDNLSKLALVNSTLRKYQKQANQKKPARELIDKLESIFEDDAARVYQDLKAGNSTEDVKFLVFNTLLDFQPVAKSEMPQYYLKGGAWKLAYVLKSFTLRQLDAYRREGLAPMREGMRTRDAAKFASGFSKLLRLYGLYVAFGAGKDFLQDFVKGIFNEEWEFDEPEDYVIDNLLKSVGWSRFQTQMAQRDGISSVVWDLVVPPTKFLDNIQKDFKQLFKDEGLSLDNSKAIRSIPIGGELYYHWFGGGSDAEEKTGKGAVAF